MRFLEKEAFTTFLSKTLSAGTKYLSSWLFDVSSSRKIAVWVSVKQLNTPSTGDVKIKLLNDTEKVQSIVTSENFTGDGTTTTFQLSRGWVVENSETVTVNGATQTRDTDYTINYETGEITFTTAPSSGASIVVSYAYIPVENLDDFNNPLFEFSNVNEFRKTFILDVESLQTLRLYVENNLDVDIDILVKSAKVSL